MPEVSGTAIEKGSINQSRTIRLPIHAVKEINGYLRAYRRLALRLPRDPEPKNVAPPVAQRLPGWLAGLRAVQQEIPSGRFGLGSRESATPEQIAAVLGIPGERARQLLNAVLRQLKKLAAEQG